MSTNFPNFSTPSAGSEAPLAMLSVCHDRIALQCATLRRLVSQLALHGANEEARTTAANVMRYFDTSAIKHHADEEDDLFPAIIESMAGSDAVCLRELTEGLTMDHRALEAHWQRLRMVLAQIVAGQSVALASDDVEALVGLYERHIEREETELLPMAARLLSDDDLGRIGRTMSARRGPAQRWIVCLCADWCGTCRDYRPVFDRLATEHPGTPFLWLDIEDEAALVGDLEIEIFPTLVIADGADIRFAGPLLPHAGTLSRLLGSLENDSPAVTSADPALNALVQTLHQRISSG